MKEEKYNYKKQTLINFARFYISKESKYLGSIQFKEENIQNKTQTENNANSDLDNKGANSERTSSEDIIIPFEEIEVQETPKNEEASKYLEDIQIENEFNPSPYNYQIYKLGYYGAASGIDNASVHFFEVNEKKHALFSTIMEDNLKNFLISYKKYLAENQLEAEHQTLVIPVVQKKNGPAESHIVLVVVDYHGGFVASQCLYDPKGKPIIDFREKSRKAIARYLEVLSGENNENLNKDDSFSFFLPNPKLKTEYIERQGAVDARNCGPFVGSFITDIAHGFDNIGTSCEKGRVEVKTLRKEDDVLIKVVNQCTANEGMLPLDHLKEAIKLEGATILDQWVFLESEHESNKLNFGSSSN